MFASSDALGSACHTGLTGSFAYTEIEPQDGVIYTYVPKGGYTFDLTTADSDISSSLPIASANEPLTATIEYTLISAGYTAADPALDLLYTADSNRSIVTQASVKVVHGIPLAGTENVFVTPADDFIKELENGDAVETAAINIEGYSLVAGSVSTVIADEPVSGGDPADFTHTCARQPVDECQFETGNLKQITAVA